MTKKKSWIFSYSIIFIIACLTVYSLQIFYGRTFIYAEVNQSGDGLVEHYNSLVYYGEWLRTVLRNIFVEHRFSIPSWDLSIGLGGDVITTLNYYVLGDPLNLLAVFIPARYTEYLYNFLVLVRLYLAGVVFYIYCRHHKYKDNMILPGALIYVFSFYTIVVSVLHPYFLNPLIYFPLILLGIDYVFENKKPFLFIFSCTLAAVTNFYFFYMMTILMVIYAAIRYIAVYGSRQGIKHFMQSAGRIAFYYIAALMMSLPVFLPSAYAVLGGNRVNGGAYVPVFYDLIYYVKLIIAFVNASADYYSALGYTSIGLLAVILLIVKKTDKKRMQLKAALLLGTVFLLIPFFGHVLNGFSYVTNRWVWAYCFIVSLIVVEMFPELLETASKTQWIAAAITILFAVLTFIFRAGGDRGKLQMAGIVLAAAIIIMIILILSDSVICKQMKDGNKLHDNMGRYVFIGILLVNLFLNSFSFYSPFSGNDIENHEKNGIAYEERMNSFFRIFERNNIDSSYVRIDTAHLEQFQGVKINSAMMYDVNSTSFSYSVINDSTNVFLRDMEIPMATDIKYVDMDARTYLDALLGCRYMVIEDGKEQYLPYGYDQLVIKEDGYAVYESNMVLPLVYTYDTYLEKEMYEQLPAAQKQQVLLQAGVLDGAGENYITRTNPEEMKFSDFCSEYQFTDMSEGIEITGSRIIVSRENASVTVSADTVENAERYFSFKNLQYIGDGTAHIQITDGDVEKDISIKSSSDTMYSGIHDILCNMGYRERHAEEYTICFLQKGIYTFDSMDIINVDMTGFEKMIEARMTDRIEYTWTEDGMTIHASEDVPKLLYVSIPYSKGWTVYVDGERTNCLHANNFGIGILLEEGEHEVVLEYHTPYMGFGCVMMLAGAGICLLIWKKSRKENGCQ